MTTSVSAAPEQPTPTTDNISRPVSLLSSVDKIRSSLPSDDLVDEEEEQFSWTTAIFRRKQIVHPDPDAIATKRAVFDDPDLAPHYWPKKDYENLHRFDPAARWTYGEERKALVRKLDWKIMLMAAGGFSALNLDRNNISQANSDSFLQDLGLTTDDFNLGNTVFRTTVTACLEANWPGSLDPNADLPLDHFSALQGGYIPDLILYLSYFYTKTELPVRLALFWMSMNFCAIIASFIAYGTLHMDGVAGAAGWRGLLTLLIGFLSFFRMPPSPTQTKTWFRPNGWFTEREEIIMVNRILRDDPTKGDMHNREGLTLRRLWTAMCDYDLWPIYIMYAFPLIFVRIGPHETQRPHVWYPEHSPINVSHFTTQGHRALGMVTMFLITIVSEFVNERSIVSMMEDLWTLPFLVALYALPSSPNPWIFFVVVTGLLSYPFVQIYVASDAPRCTKAYYIWRNRQRARIWDAMTTQERAHYLSTTKDVGNRRLDFRFAH
ncbi:allantoate permease [Suillus bovinus]|uniref:allantoate permease n=1 Tax=Suillus bovinus TaxID=48563 RepID=UPI001B87EB94|nr:allantoate permease [Suillus bovinus]KAG2137400.1 allantoate permease [Suillus bovinus]